MRHSIAGLSISLLCVLQWGIQGGVITHTMTFTPADVSFGKYDGYDVVRMERANGACEPGYPDVPQINEYFLIPATAEVEKIEAAERSVMELAGRFRVMPAQAPCPLSQPELCRKTAPNATVYASSALYPETVLETSPSGSCCGFRIAGIRFSPLQYQPREGRLFLTTRATIVVRYRERVYPSKTISERQYRAFLPLINNLIRNPGDAGRFSPRVRPDDIIDVNYAVVTDDALKGGFDSFKLWKTKKGFRTEVFTTSWIYDKYTGYDNAEKVRNFLIDYYKTKGLVYALLAGDCDKVPHRIVKVNLSPGDLASDYYFGDLDGTWDTNNDHKYGEPRADSVDGYFDIFPGRLPADNLEQVGSFVHKDTTMEKRPPGACLKKYLLASANLFGTKHGSELNNMLADTSSPGWLDIKLEDPSRYALRDSINKGPYMIHINSHGELYQFTNTNDGPMLHSDDVGSMTGTNGSYPILYSTACHVGEFNDASQECIGELLLNKQNGGLAAAILNTRLGWFSPDAGKIHGTDLLAIQFAAMFFKRDTATIGQILVAMKHLHRETAWAKSKPDMMMHYCINEVTLFGDPDLPLYRDIPAPLSAIHANFIAAGKQNFTVTVGASAPLAGALVCCYKEGEVHATGYTDASGKAAIAIDPKTSGVMYVTATAKERLPFEDVCNVGTTVAGWNGTVASGAGIVAMRQDMSGGLAVRFTLTRPSEAHGVLYDARGAAVRVLRPFVRPPGLHTLNMNGLRAGVYTLSLSAAGFESRKKIIIVK